MKRVASSSPQQFIPCLLYRVPHACSCLLDSLLDNEQDESTILHCSFSFSLHLYISLLLNANNNTQRVTYESL